MKTDIELLDDLDFSSSTLTFPLGVFSNGTCVAFSGRFQGNGHSIKGLKMNNTNNAGYKHAGLFHRLNNATVENLVIDSSCSFTGYYVGALSVSVGGSLTVISTKNKAAVSGTWDVGGFIGYMKDLEQPSVVSFEDCVNDGNVTGSQNDVGGLVGIISDNVNMTITISNSTNNGNVHGDGYVGGFVGYMSNNNNITFTISNSTNNGIVTGSGNVGGFVGYIDSNTNMTLTISNSTNNGIVTGNNNRVGGFVGLMSSNTNMTMTISNSTNNGNVTGNNNRVGGFVGYMINNNNNITFTISNSTNNGIITGSCSVGGLLG